MTQLTKTISSFGCSNCGKHVENYIPCRGNCGETHYCEESCLLNHASAHRRLCFRLQLENAKAEEPETDSDEEEEEGLYSLSPEAERRIEKKLLSKLKEKEDERIAYAIKNQINIINEQYQSQSLEDRIKTNLKDDINIDLSDEAEENSEDEYTEEDTESTDDEEENNEEENLIRKERYYQDKNKDIEINELLNAVNSESLHENKTLEYPFDEDLTLDSLKFLVCEENPPQLTLEQEQKQDKEIHHRFIIKSFSKDCKRIQASGLCIGDVLLTIKNISVLNKSLNEVNHLLLSIKKPFIMKFYSINVAMMTTYEILWKDSIPLGLSFRWNKSKNENESYCIVKRNHSKHNSISYKMNIQPGDVLLSINGKQLHYKNDLEPIKSINLLKQPIRLVFRGSNLFRSSNEIQINTENNVKESKVKESKKQEMNILATNIQQSKKKENNRKENNVKEINKQEIDLNENILKEDILEESNNQECIITPAIILERKNAQETSLREEEKIDTKDTKEAKEAKDTKETKDTKEEYELTKNRKLDSLQTDYFNEPSLESSNKASKEEEKKLSLTILYSENSSDDSFNEDFNKSILIQEDNKEKSFDIMKITNEHEKEESSLNTISSLYSVIWSDGYLGITLCPPIRENSYPSVSRITGKATFNGCEEIELSDKLIKINQRDIQSLSFSNICLLLKNSVKPVELVFCRHQEHRSSLRESKVSYLPYTPISDSDDEYQVIYEGGKLGIVLGYIIKEGNSKEPFLQCIKANSILTHSQAKIGDKLVAVNNYATLSLNPHQVKSLVRNATKPAVLRFRSFQQEQETFYANSKKLRRKTSSPIIEKDDKVQSMDIQRRRTAIAEKLREIKLTKNKNNNIQQDNQRNHNFLSMKDKEKLEFLVQRSKGEILDEKELNKKNQNTSKEEKNEKGNEEKQNYYQVVWKEGKLGITFVAPSSGFGPILVKKVSNGLASSLGCQVRPGDELSKINNKILSRELGFEEIMTTLKDIEKPVTLGFNTTNSRSYYSSFNKQVKSITEFKRK